MAPPTSTTSFKGILDTMERRTPEDQETFQATPTKWTREMATMMMWMTRTIYRATTSAELMGN